MQRVAEDGKSRVVVAGQLNAEDIGHHRAIAVHDRRTIVELTLQSRRDLDRLHLGLEGTRERPIDHPVEGILKPS